MLLLWFAGSFLLRYDARAFVGLLFQEPPRSVGALFPWVHSRKKFPRRLRRQEKGKREKRKGN
jgi:hypothetical protein